VVEHQNYEMEMERNSSENSIIIVCVGKEMNEGNLKA